MDRVHHFLHMTRFIFFEGLQKKSWRINKYKDKRFAYWQTELLVPNVGPLTQNFKEWFLKQAVVRKLSSNLSYQLKRKQSHNLVFFCLAPYWWKWEYRHEWHKVICMCSLAVYVNHFDLQKVPMSNEQV